jgi:hypothetical protein
MPYPRPQSKPMFSMTNPPDVWFVIVSTLLPDALPTKVSWKLKELGLEEISVVFCAKASVVRDTIKQMQQAAGERVRRVDMVIEETLSR